MRCCFCRTRRKSYDPNRVRKKSQSHHQLEEGDMLMCVNGKPLNDQAADDVMMWVDTLHGSLSLDIVRPSTSGGNLPFRTPSPLPDPSKPPPPGILKVPKAAYVPTPPPRQAYLTPIPPANPIQLRNLSSDTSSLQSLSPYQSPIRSRSVPSVQQRSSSLTSFHHNTSGPSSGLGFTSSFTSGSGFSSGVNTSSSNSSSFSNRLQRTGSGSSLLQRISPTPPKLDLSLLSNLKPFKFPTPSPTPSFSETTQSTTWNPEDNSRITETRTVQSYSTQYHPVAPPVITTQMYQTPPPFGPQQNGGGLLSPSTGMPIQMKFYQPAPLSPDIEQVIENTKHKKKLFGSSSFYEEPNAIYPTIEEQVDLARKIADSLSSDTNRSSRGANMFFKRVKKSHKWIHPAPDPFKEYGKMSFGLNGNDEIPDPSEVPYKVSKDPPKLKHVMAPRPIHDATTLANTGVNIAHQNVASPDICLKICTDLNTHKGKGARMFAKRKSRADEWVVNVDKLKAKLGDRWPDPAPEPNSFNHHNDYYQMPISANQVADSVLRAAEVKEPWVTSNDHLSIRPAQTWKSASTGNLASYLSAPSPIPVNLQSNFSLNPRQFRDFNTSPRGFGQQSHSASFRSVYLPAYPQHGTAF